MGEARVSEVMHGRWDRVIAAVGYGKPRSFVFNEWWVRLHKLPVWGRELYSGSNPFRFCRLPVLGMGLGSFAIFGTVSRLHTTPLFREASIWLHELIGFPRFAARFGLAK